MRCRVAFVHLEIVFFPLKIHEFVNALGTRAALHLIVKCISFNVHVINFVAIYSSCKFSHWYCYKWTKCTNTVTAYKFVYANAKNSGRMNEKKKQRLFQLRNLE